MKLGYKFSLLACLLAGSAFAQADPDETSTDIVKQQTALTATTADMDLQIKARVARYNTTQQQKVKYDTLGLGAFRADVANLKKIRRAQQIAFIKKHPDYFVSLKALKEVIGPLPEDIKSIEPLYSSLDKNIRNTETGLKVKNTIDRFKTVAIGAMAPLFIAPDTAGSAIKLESYRGKYVLLDFWASWCVPCREENPNVVAAYNRYKNQNFDILSVSLDQPGKKDAWIKAIKDDGLTWQHVSDLKYWSNEVAKLYVIGSIPQNFLIDPKGKIIAVNLRGVELNQKLESLLSGTSGK